MTVRPVSCKVSYRGPTREGDDVVTISIGHRWALGFGLVFLFFVWLNNTNAFLVVPDRSPLILAHRGLAQTFSLAGVAWDTNTARIIHPPEHEYLENTIPSMRAAFAAGADIVEFDVRLTRDHKLAVFHDFLLEYRTNGTGQVSDTAMADLRTLDVGYGYTADGGKTFPLRGKGVGLLVSSEEVFAAFPEKSFLVHIKDGGGTAGNLLVEQMRGFPSDRVARLAFYGDHDAVMEIRKHYPAVKVLSMNTLKRALIAYLLIDWTGWIPEAIRNTQLKISEVDRCFRRDCFQ